MEASGEFVKIRVKSASHRCEDLEISCPLDSSIRNVKEIIKDQYPLHPEIKEQRIIYAGHLLEDDQFLRDIFAQGGQVSVSGGYTFHLACNSTFLRKTVNKSTEDEIKKEEQTATGEGDCNPRESANQPPQGVPPAGIPQDMLALHQLYVEQMMNFMSQWNQGNFGPVWMPSPMPPMMHGIRIPSEQVLPPQVMNQVPQMPVPPQMNQQPLYQQDPAPRNDPPAPPPVVARVQDDDEPQRDILDWIYTGSRLFLILSVVYFYSNFTRFLLVLLFTALVMLAQRRPRFLNALQPQQPAAPQPAQRPANDNQQIQEENVAPDVLEGAAAVDGEGEAVPSDSAAPSPPEELIPAQVQQQQTFLDIARTFVMTFVTSLIPELNP